MVSVSTLQSWLKITGDDAIVAAIESGVVAFLETFTGRLFTSPAASVMDILDGGDAAAGDLLPSDRVVGPPWLLLREEPNGGAITEVYYRDTPAAAWTAQGTADYELDGRQLFLLDGTFPTGRRNVRVDYMFGYAEDGGPSDAHLVVLQLVKFLYERRDAGIIKSAAIGPMRISYADAKQAGLEMQVEALKRPTLPF